MVGPYCHTSFRAEMPKFIFNQDSTGMSWLRKKIDHYLKKKKQNKTTTTEQQQNWSRFDDCIATTLS